MTKHELLLLEIRIADREREMEQDMNKTKGRGYFRMWEECGNLQKRLIKNKNIF
jgi:deoxyadenosine/deoxycytidine kinase